MKTNTLNSIAQEKYGKDYNHLPDDGAEQDFVQGEYARREKLSTIKPINGLDEPEKAFEIKSGDCQPSQAGKFMDTICPDCQAEFRKTVPKRSNRFYVE